VSLVILLDFDCIEINFATATTKSSTKKSKSTTQAPQTTIPESSESDESEFSCFMGV
jgi:hypothetical protein